MMQNGHLIDAGALKNSASLTNLIFGRGFSSVFRRHLQKTTPSLGAILRGDGFLFFPPPRF